MTDHPAVAAKYLDAVINTFVDYVIPVIQEHIFHEIAYDLEPCDPDDDFRLQEHYQHIKSRFFDRLASYSSHINDLFNNEGLEWWYNDVLENWWQFEYQELNEEYYRESERRIT